MDVGGKRKGPRGEFRPPVKPGLKWEYLNSDASTDPDYCCTAEQIPVQDASIDTVVMTELMEYLPRPRKVLFELFRITRPGGHILISTPFLNPIHGDYCEDRARYTSIMLKEMVVGTGFKVLAIESMGSVGAVIYDTIRVAFGYASDSRISKYFAKILRATVPFFRWVDKRSKFQSKYIHTGYFIVLKR